MSSTERILLRVLITGDRKKHANNIKQTLLYGVVVWFHTLKLGISFISYTLTDFFFNLNNESDICSVISKTTQDMCVKLIIPPLPAPALNPASPKVISINSLVCHSLTSCSSERIYTFWGGLFNFFHGAGPFWTA